VIQNFKVIHAHLATIPTCGVSVKIAAQVAKSVGDFCFSKFAQNVLVANKLFYLVSASAI